MNRCHFPLIILVPSDPVTPGDFESLVIRKREISLWRSEGATWEAGCLVRRKRLPFRSPNLVFLALYWHVRNKCCISCAFLRFWNLGPFCALFYCGFWTFEQKSIGFYCKFGRAKFWTYYTSSKWIDSEKTLEIIVFFDPAILSDQWFGRGNPLSGGARERSRRGPDGWRWLASWLAG